MRPHFLALTLLAATLGACSAVSGSDTTGLIGWEEPPDYSFVLASTCGEGSLIGSFDVTVRDHRTHEATALDDSATAALQGSREIAEIPTLQDLVHEAAEAQATGADVTEVAVDRGDGHPTRIDIDFSTDAIDDEACYVIGGYTVTTSQP